MNVMIMNCDSIAAYYVRVKLLWLCYLWTRGMVGMATIVNNIGQYIVCFSGHLLWDIVTWCFTVCYIV